VLAHTPVDLVLRRMALRHASNFRFDAVRSFRSWKPDLNGGPRITRHASRRRAGPAAEGRLIGLAPPESQGAALDMQITCSHVSHMAVMVQIRHMPDDLHRRLKSRAALAGMSLSEYLLRELRDVAERPTPEEMRARLAGREKTALPESIVDILRQERDGR
ncbi:MAG TPA: hypothetical protein VMU37_05430, partial [Caulobacteraceae bacterium]|nr:hypothetical protein [Caulobacteraceae bacterium]